MCFYPVYENISILLFMLSFQHASGRNPEISLKMNKKVIKSPKTEAQQ